ncbi:MAG: hypothetical protein EXQ55_05490 [Acidobacteria bacterium]|nr:hypothetical protein [Acidobacteriota bacterium]
MEIFPGPKPFSRAPTGSSALLTYEPYYGLREKPFSLSVDPKFLYKSPSHAAAYEDLLLGIRRREGLIVLTGDIGTGKTTLCRAVLENLDRKTFSTFVPDPFVSREDLEGPEAFHVAILGESLPALSLHGPPPSRHRSGLGESHSTRKWRHRAARVAMLTAIAGAVAFFALLGEAVYLTQFPEVTQQTLPLPTVTPLLRLAPVDIPIPVPQDVTSPPVPARDPSVDSPVEEPAPLVE